MTETSTPPFDQHNNEKPDNITSELSTGKQLTATQVWLENTFKKYYFKYNSNIEIETFFSEREFGFKLFDGKIRRHIKFHNEKELFANIMKFSPSDIYCSSARYQNPTANIEDKGWIGADLIFDIDGKDLNLNCAQTHNLTQCKKCGNIENGISSKCARCESTAIQIVDLPCKKCVKALKDEVKKLIAILTDDFGVQKNSTYVYFSGNNGFHIKVVDENLFKASSLKRRAYVQYFQGKDYSIDNLGFKLDKTTNAVTVLPNKILYDGGWRARILGDLRIQLRNHKLEDKSIRKILHFNETHDIPLLDYIQEKIKYHSVTIDSSVTMDIHRIFRLSGTLNSKSGLIKAYCKDLESFDPLVSACFIGDSIIRIRSKASIKLSLKSKLFDIGIGINEVPEYVAVYLVLKGIADWIGV